MRYPIIASYTRVLPLFYYGIGLRPENLSDSGEPFCIWYLLSPCLRPVLLGGMDPCPPALSKRPQTQDPSLCSVHLDRRTHREHGVHPGVSFFFADGLLKHMIQNWHPRPVTVPALYSAIQEE